MKVLQFIERQNSKDEEKLKKMYEWYFAKQEYMQKKWDEYNVKRSSWSDGSGYVVDLYEMEAEDYAKMISDDEFQSEWVRVGRFFNTWKMRVLRPVLVVPPE